MFGCCHWEIHLGQIPEANYERPNGVTDPTATLLHGIAITTLNMILHIKLIIESGGSPMQRVNEILAGARSKGQSQDVRGGEVGDGMGEALGRLVCREAETDRVVSVTGV